MDLRLQKFVATMETLSDIRNVDPSNPVMFNLEHPVTSTRFVTIAAMTEPSYMGIPINIVWTVLDSRSPYYKQCLKLRASVNPTNAIAGLVLLPGLRQSWTLVKSYDEVFADPQYYDNGSGGGTPGPKGLKGDTGPVGAVGPMGLMGAAGPSPVLDYPAIITEVLARMPASGSAEPTLSISGAGTLLSGAVSQYHPELTFGTTVVRLVNPISVSAGASTISSLNVLTAAILSGLNTSLSISVPFNGKTLTATKTVVVSETGVAALAIGSLPPTLVEGTQTQLVATATYANGTNTNVTSSAVWTVSPTGAATISASGLLTVALVSADTAFTITATFTDGSTKTSTASITAKNIVVNLLTIAGAASVPGGTTSTYTATARRSDNTTAVVSPTWSVNPSTLGTINSSGVFTAAASTVADTTGTVAASYTFEGVTVTATLPVVVPSSVAIVYPYYGSALTNAVINETLIKSLASRGTTATRMTATMTIIDSTTKSLYYAYPVSYGPATFTDLGNGFQGGWDGAHKNAGMTMGPVTVNVLVNGVQTPFYVYQADYPNISSLASPTAWSVT